MNMQSKIRHVSGEVEINFFAEGRSNDAEITETSRGDDLLKLYYDQLFSPYLTYDQKYLTLAPENNLKYKHNGCLDGSFRLLGKNSNIGWQGNCFSKDDGSFDVDQTLRLEFSKSRELDYLMLCGTDAYGQEEYPMEYELAFKNEKNQALIVKDLKKEVISRDGKRLERIDFTLSGPVNAIELIIKKWSVANTTAKITYFSGEKIERFNGKNLKSIEVLEEKTGDVDKLSYGISTNYCKVEFLNENKQFYESKNYSLLRKNRRVLPYIKCGDNEPALLGKFYSDEWKLDDSSMYMSVKAYDILYSLQSMIINYGMDVSGVKDKGLPLSTYTKKTVVDVFARVFELINQERRNNGIFDGEILCTLRLSEENLDLSLPYVLIEDKSAWDILQDLANLCCAYIYADRDGRIIVQEDYFWDETKKADGTTAKTDKKYKEYDLSKYDISEEKALPQDFVKFDPVYVDPNKPMQRIDPTNSFSYSLPITSRTVVNKVNVEYYSLDEDVNKDIEIKIDECEPGNEPNTIIATVKLDKVYEKIETIETDYNELVTFVGVKKCNYNELAVVLKKSNNFKENSFKLIINNKLSTKIYKHTKKTYSKDDASSIKENGLVEYDCKLGMLLTKIDHCKPITEKLITKYRDGVEYLDAEWKGDYDLQLNDKVIGRSLYDDKFVTEVYECLSNELKLGSNFRQKTKGRWLWDE